jgi:hypothetical protein
VGLDARDDAARDWYGYGQWSAPYWLIGMEPGGSDDATSYDVWQQLGGDELIDCRKHHLESGFKDWHEARRPPTQPTWRRLIQLILAFRGEPTDMDAVSLYQRDHFGSVDGETAVIELSALHAPSLSVSVDRMRHRDERVLTIKRRFKEYRPKLAIFYGRTPVYRDAYEQIIGASFNSDDVALVGTILCALVPHPTWQGGPAPEYWVELGRCLRRRADGATGAAIPSYRDFMHARSSQRSSTRSNIRTDGSVMETFDIVRAGTRAGRITYDGWHVSVDQYDDVTNTYKLMGRYENTRPDQWARKTKEIDSIFDSWRSAPIKDATDVKVVWRARAFVPDFDPPKGAIRAGCSIVEEAGLEIGRVYKLANQGAVWHSRSQETP